MRRRPGWRESNQARPERGRRNSRLDFDWLLLSLCLNLNLISLYSYSAGPDNRISTILTLSRADELNLHTNTSSLGAQLGCAYDDDGDDGDDNLFRKSASLRLRSRVALLAHQWILVILEYHHHHHDERNYH